MAYCRNRNVGFFGSCEIKCGEAFLKLKSLENTRFLKLCLDIENSTKGNLQ